MKRSGRCAEHCTNEQIQRCQMHRSARRERASSAEETAVNRREDAYLLTRAIQIVTRFVRDGIKHVGGAPPPVQCDSGNKRVHSIAEDAMSYGSRPCYNQKRSMLFLVAFCTRSFFSCALLLLPQLCSLQELHVRLRLLIVWEDVVRVLFETQFRLCKEMSITQHNVLIRGLPHPSCSAACRHVPRLVHTPCAAS